MGCGQRPEQLQSCTVVGDPLRSAAHNSCEKRYKRSCATSSCRSSWVLGILQYALYAILKIIYIKLQWWRKGVVFADLYEYEYQLDLRHIIREEDWLLEWSEKIVKVIQSFKMYLHKSTHFYNKAKIIYLFSKSLHIFWNIRAHVNFLIESIYV